MGYSINQGRLIAHFRAVILGFIGGKKGRTGLAPLVEVPAHAVTPMGSLVYSPLIIGSHIETGTGISSLIPHFPHNHRHFRAIAHPLGTVS